MRKYNWRWLYDQMEIEYEPLYWMPLPAPPKGE